MGKKSKRRNRNVGSPPAVRASQNADDEEVMDIIGVPRRFEVQAIMMRNYLFDTKTPNGCHHGALPPSDEREELGMILTIYFTERTKDEEDCAPLGFTNLQFLYRYRPTGIITQELANLVLHDAANHVMNGEHSAARLLARIHMVFQCWLNAGKPAVPFQEQDIKKYFQQSGYKLPEWYMEGAILINTIETHLEVARYIDKFLPCNCLAESKKAIAIKKDADKGTVCHHCKKAAPASELKKCSKCQVAAYCSKECQAKDWSFHKAMCRLYCGESFKEKELSKVSNIFLENLRKEQERKEHEREVEQALWRYFFATEK